MIRAFAKSPYEASSYVNRFYRGLQRVEERFTTARKIPQLLTSSQQQAWLNREKMQLAWYSLPAPGASVPRIQMLREIREEIGDVAQAMRIAQSSRKLNAQEKADNLRRLASMRDAAAEAAFRLLSQADQERVF